jgi:hypothetical protein
MNESQYEVAKLQQELDRMNTLGYELYCNLGVSIDALNQILEVPYNAASDGRAVKEMVRIAKFTLETILDDKVAEPLS